MAKEWKREHWLYKIIPRTWAEAGWWPFEWVLWALFGNDEDGIFGEYSQNWSSWYPEPSFKVFALWWLRNPLCNFFTHVINWKWAHIYLVWRWNAAKGHRFFLKTEPQIWEDEKAHFTLAAIPPDIQWRFWRCEGYLGWGHGASGKFGLAVRKAGSTWA